MDTKAKQEYDKDIKADPRITEVRISCFYCKHALQIVNPYGYSPDSICNAFPSGIPYSIQKRIEKHNKVLPLQEGTNVYESRQVYDAEDGNNFVTWEGEWVKSVGESKT